MRKNIN
nr:ORF1 [Drosophila melanogaster]